MSPTVVLKEDGSPFLVLGTPGGSRIFSGVAEVISRVIDSGMDLKTAASGAMQSIMFMDDGTLYGIGDPRQDGKAVGVD
jgi:gamma-glutamyltranspeptidase/glutathione hydrolase